MKNLKTLKIALLSLALLCFIGSAKAQKKYAVLIAADHFDEDLDISGLSLWNGQATTGHRESIEFWNDTYLMWKMLQEKGFLPEDIFVLYADGIDYSVHENLAEEYTPQEGIIVTDYPADYQSVENVFNGLCYGNDSIPMCTEDDFLFVWTFDHGGGLIDGSYYLLLIDKYICDYELADLANPIKANKKVYWMQQCCSGGFADDLAAPNTVFISACQADEGAWPADDLPYIENEIIDGVKYTHGEFNFHMISSVWWKSPTGSEMYGPHYFSDSDINNDSITSMSEAFGWLSNHATYPNGGTPLFSDIGNIASSTSLEYPTILHENITANTTLRGDIALSKNVHITSGNTLYLHRNAKFTLFDSTEMIVDPGASLVIDNNVEIIGTSGCKILVQGNISVGRNVLFTKKSNSNNGGVIEIVSPQANVTLESVTFDSTQFICTSNSIIMDSCTVSGIDTLVLQSEYVEITNSEFNLSGLVARSGTLWFSQSSTIYINENTFTYTEDDDIKTAIELNRYNNFHIQENTISGFTNGIQTFYCGNSNPNSQVIEKNNISNCSHSGITVYNTTSIIRNNKIRNNDIGIKFMNNCNTEFYGKLRASDIFDTQLIKDNIQYQIYASQNSFPYYIKYNAIIYDDNIVPLVMYDREDTTYIEVDISENYWGYGFSPNDLYIENGVFIYLPMWEPQNPHYPTPLNIEYQNASQAFANGDYTEAQLQFMSIIENSPESSYAEAAMKELLRVGTMANTLGQLKNYYLNNNTILANDNLATLGDFLANVCDVRMENWADAIDWYEDKIINSPNEQERIFAEIDLGYLYLLMENSDGKAISNVVGTMKQHKYESVEMYNNNRDYLLSLLPGKTLSESLKGELRSAGAGELIQNYPNPFSQSTTIWYKTDREAQVQLVVFDLTGEEVVRLDEGLKYKGVHSIEFTNSSLAEGIYLYTLMIDGQMTDSKKMNIIR